MSMQLGSIQQVRLVAQGSHGDVWEAIAPGGQRVALKLLGEHLLSEPDPPARLRREGSLAALVRSPYVCNLLGEGEDEARGPFLVYEFLEGETLGAALRREPLDPARALAVVRGALLGLAAAHAVGVIHRDVQPENVFLCADGQVKLLDFGVAYQAGALGASITSEGMLLGAVTHMAPEQFVAARKADGRADLYGVGSTLFEALAGRPPFRAPSPMALLSLKLNARPPTLAAATGKAWPAPLEAFVARLLEGKAANRYESAHEALDALAELRRAIRARGGA